MNEPTGVKINTAKGTDSHLPVLAWAQAHTAGSVLEFGGGMYSTPQLVEWKRHGFRTATIEESPKWRAWMRDKWPNHRVYDRLTTELLDEGWGVVLIDHGEGEWAWIDARAAALTAVRGHCEVALVHDWHIGPGHRGELVEEWAHHAWFAPYSGMMHTAICSDSVEVETARIPGGRIYTGWDNAPTEWPN